MIKGIDHIVVVVPDLEDAITKYGELGFTVVRGGKHNIGTHNALIAFADGSYVELIAFLTPVADLDAAVEAALGRLDARARVAMIPEGPLTVATIVAQR